MSRIRTRDRRNRSSAAKEVYKRRKVEKVATMKRQGKLKDMTMKSGGRTIRTRGKRSDWKKAIITLKEGYSIDLIRGESGV